MATRKTENHDELGLRPLSKTRLFQMAQEDGLVTGRKSSEFTKSQLIAMIERNAFSGPSRR